MNRPRSFNGVDRLVILDWFHSGLTMEECAAFWGISHLDLEDAIRQWFRYISKKGRRWQAR